MKRYVDRMKKKKKLIVLKSSDSIEGDKTVMKISSIFETEKPAN